MTRRSSPWFNVPAAGDTRAVSSAECVTLNISPGLPRATIDPNVREVARFSRATSTQQMWSTGSEPVAG